MQAIFPFSLLSTNWKLSLRSWLFRATLRITRSCSNCRLNARLWWVIVALASSIFWVTLEVAPAWHVKNFLRRVSLSVDIAIFLTIKNTVACYSSILAVPLIADVNRPVALAYCILMMHCILYEERLFS